MKYLKILGKCLLAVLLTILTLGVYIRFHLITARKRHMGGVRGGLLGGKHVYESQNKATFIVVSTWRGKTRMPVMQLNHTASRMSVVTIAMYGKRQSIDVFSWQAARLAEFVNDRVSDTQMTVAQA